MHRGCSLKTAAGTHCWSDTARMGCSFFQKVSEFTKVIVSPPFQKLDPMPNAKRNSFFFRSRRLELFECGFDATHSNGHIGRPIFAIFVRNPLPIVQTNASTRIPTILQCLDDANEAAVVEK
mmetsp:Transcript_2928/g.4456  ORF Transcript_2928/g.4456 Transcript_2928/m.4456 type:complete len:122 (-) Transcript_2928:2016-2381(-)